MGYAAEVLADRPLFYFRLGEASGTSAADLGSIGAAAAISGGPTMGEPGALVDSADTSLRFPASTGALVAVPDHPSLQGGQAFTVEMWVKRAGAPTNGDGQDYPVLQRYTSHAPPYYVRGWNVSSTQIRANIAHNGAAGDIATITVVTGVLLDWHHVVLAYDGRYVWHYLDGQLGATHDFGAYGSITSVTTGFEIGRNTNLGTQYGFNGWVDEVACYGTVLPIQRVRAHYAEGRRRGYTAEVRALRPRVLLRLGEASGGAVNEVTGAPSTVTGAANRAVAGLVAADTDAALELTATSSVVAVPNAEVAGVLAGAATVAGFVKLTSSPGGYQLWSQADGASGNAAPVVLIATSGGGLLLRTGTGGGESDIFNSGGVGLTNGVTRHLAVTFGSGSPYAVKVYVDGVLMLSTTTTQTRTDIGNALRIGQRQDGTGGHPGVVWDEFCVLPVELSAAQVRRLYSARVVVGAERTVDGPTAISTSALGASSLGGGFGGPGGVPTYIDLAASAAWTVSAAATVEPGVEFAASATWTVSAAATWTAGLELAVGATWSVAASVTVTWTVAPVIPPTSVFITAAATAPAGSVVIAVQPLPYAVAAGTVLVFDAP